MNSNELKSIFRGVFSRDENLPPPYIVECAILNLDNSYSTGTHWTCYFKDNNVVHYYDSFGNLGPPKELLDHFARYDIYYNRYCEQEYDTVICGHLCLRYLMEQYYKYRCHS